MGARRGHRPRVGELQELALAALACRWGRRAYEFFEATLARRGSN
jgi:hypothetical protein